jgi:hypothetical protein
MKHVREQFFLAATAQNLKRLARFLRSKSLESATVPIWDRKRKRDTPQENHPSSKLPPVGAFFNSHAIYQQSGNGL